jgi:tRNA pseudouridine55 synthase
MIEPSGLLLINKPIGITSFQVIRMIRRSTGVKKIGHSGTLDKNATGLLVLGIGKGTKHLTEILSMEKSYLFRIQFGCESETGDTLGTTWSYQAVSENLVKRESILKTIKEHFFGEIWQTPPIYSALKKNGKRLSDYARDNIFTMVEPRKVNITHFSLLHFSYDSYMPSAIFKITCSRGTYIRSIGKDMGQILSTKAVMTNLCRTSLGPYQLSHASVVDSITSLTDLEHKLISLEPGGDGN